MHFIIKLIRLFKEQHARKIKRDYEMCFGEESPQILSGKLKKNIDSIKARFEGSSDLIIREFSFSEKKGREVNAVLIFLDGMVNMPIINDNIIKPLMHDKSIIQAGKISGAVNIEDIRDKFLTVGDVKTVYTYNEVIEACLSGNAVFMADGSCKALDIGAKGWDKRAVTEPTSETALRGPREGFTESLRTNTTMIRRKIKDPALKITDTVIGKRTHTQISILYIEGIADPELVREVEQRLKNIDTDSILATGYVEQYIEDSSFTVFSTIWSSEKPDAVAGKLLEGRVAIAVDGAPFVMTVPMLFIENFQNAEDYIIRSHFATAMRLLRLTAFFISLFAPALYIALTTYHQELIPTTLLFTMAASSEGVPFPAAVEMSLMMIIFEILREAGIRMPRPVGQTISIVGALVMGEAAVNAGIVGAPVVIVVAITAVSSFAIPFAADGVSLLGWFLLIMASTMGSFGITVGAFMILMHLTSLRSFGAYYMAPLAPFQRYDLKDTAVRVPLRAMNTRPQATKPQDLKRESAQPPQPSNASKYNRSRK
ncbi:spore germination protein KA [Ruminiclostridium sufflavum DSM 19573]|uniref:Spore germination protein KA n=1 Tax=Ruminiclostridium sufflavum DSM 19573 TaxID=1121337 RepID=A0A318XLQ9_9FIRM|nr:spore germination protein [Ruminiclostridium sufflavum]PYG86902.1 spore germination protein KA [Ruminiclostridium sufflavum DSM 19573]